MLDRKVVSGYRGEAKELLVHYFRVVAEKPKQWSGDCEEEVEQIVDLIVEAAKAEMRAER